MRRFMIPALIAAAFVAGLLTARTVVPAHAQAPALMPQIIDLATMTDADIGELVPNLGTLRSRTLVAHPHGTMAVQTGNVPKHTHSDADEFQYVISGTGTFWLGNQQREVPAT